MHKYDISFISYNAPFIIPSNCNSITFLNVGTATAYIEGVPLLVDHQSLLMVTNANILKHIIL